jgi:hypothetical protein
MVVENDQILVDNPEHIPTSGNGLALDVIVVSPSILGDSNGSTSTKSDDPLPDLDTGSMVASSDFFVSFPNFEPNKSALAPSEAQHEEVLVLIEINKVILDPSMLSLSLSTKTVSKETSQKKYKFKQGNSTKPSSEILRQLVNTNHLLHNGSNSIRYILAVARNNHHTSSIPLQKYKAIDSVQASLYLWNVNDCVVVFDIDGTITRSNVRGVISTIVTEKYDHVHDGICTFLTSLVNHKHEEEPTHKARDSTHGDVVVTSDPNQQNQLNQGGIGNVRVLYLSARPVKFIQSTRKFIHQLRQHPTHSQEISNSQNNNSEGGGGESNCLSCFNPTLSIYDEEYDFCNDSIQDNNVPRLPPGPIFLNPEKLSSVLYTEMVTKTIYEFKSETLLRQVVTPFVAAGKEKDEKIFLAGFGNTELDAKAYSLVGMEKEQIFIIDKKSKLRNEIHVDGNGNSNGDAPPRSMNKEHTYLDRVETFSGYHDQRLLKLTIKMTNEIKTAFVERNNNNSKNL